MLRASFEDVSIVDLRDIEPGPREEACWNFYNSLYLPAFPALGQREGPDIWLRLLAAECDPPLPLLHLIVAKGHSDGGRILGGFVCEFYRESGCGLGTYLVVDPSVRRRGLGRKLFEHGRAMLGRDANASPDRPFPLFAETDDPRRLSGNAAPVDLWNRLRALGALGFLACDLPYVQPPLSPGQPSVDWMMLVVHGPSLGGNRSISATVVRGFLDEFYRALGVAEPRQDRDFEQMVRWLAKHDPIGLASLESFWVRPPRDE